MSFSLFFESAWNSGQFNMNKDWLITNVTAVELPTRADNQVFFHIFDVFVAKLGRFCV